VSVDQLLQRIADLESQEQGLHRTIADYETSISIAARERRASDAADRRIRDLEQSITGTQRESVRVRSQIRGIQAELNSLR